MLSQSLFFLWIAHFVVDFCVGIWPIYKTMAHVDIATAALMTGLCGFVGELMQIPFGYLCDRGHRKKILLLGVGLSSFILWITFIKQPVLMIYPLLLMMLGSGAFHPAGAGLAGSMFQKKRAKAILFFSSGGSIGLAVSQMVFTGVSGYFNGHIWILLLPIGFLCLMLALHSFPATNQTHEQLSVKNSAKLLSLHRKPLSLLYFAQLSSYAVAASFFFFLPDLLQEKGLHPWLCLGGGHLCLILGSGLAMVPIGSCADRWGSKNLLLFTLTGSIIFLYLFLHATLSTPIAALTLMGIGAMLWTTNPLIVAWGNKLLPEHSSTVSGLLMGCAWCIGNLGTAFAGGIYSYFATNPYVATITLMSTLLFISLLLIISMPRAAPVTAAIQGPGN